MGEGRSVADHLAGPRACAERQEGGARDWAGAERQAFAEGREKGRARGLGRQRPGREEGRKERAEGKKRKRGLVPGLG